MGFYPIIIQEARGFSGGIWVLLSNIIIVNFIIFDTHEQAITFELWRDVAWACSAIYASPNPVNREIMWSHIFHIRNFLLAPWMLLGDFNKIMYSSKVRGGEFLPN